MLSRQPLKSSNRSASAHSQEETAGVSCGLRTPANGTDCRFTGSSLPSNFQILRSFHRGECKDKCRTLPTRNQFGFTLIELSIAIALMAVMTILSWRSLDGMTRAQSSTRQYSDDVLALQAGLTQWGADLDALTNQPSKPSLLWDGRALLILRSGVSTRNEGLTVVAWSRRDVDGAGQWLRWQSAPVTTRDELQLAWDSASSWSQNHSEQDKLREVRVMPLDQWKIYYYINDGWSNPLSNMQSADSKEVAIPIVPKGIRVVLSLSDSQAISGTLTRDWIRPDVGGGK
jgi:general secretion pathway protein J